MSDEALPTLLKVKPIAQQQAALVALAQELVRYPNVTAMLREECKPDEAHVSRISLHLCMYINPENLIGFGTGNLIRQRLNGPDGKAILTDKGKTQMTTVPFQPHHRYGECTKAEILTLTINPFEKMVLSSVEYELLNGEPLISIKISHLRDPVAVGNGCYMAIDRAHFNPRCVVQYRDNVLELPDIARNIAYHMNNVKLTIVPGGRKVNGPLERWEADEPHIRAIVNEFGIFRRATQFVGALQNGCVLRTFMGVTPVQISVGMPSKLKNVLDYYKKMGIVKLDLPEDDFGPRAPDFHDDPKAYRRWFRKYRKPAARIDEHEEKLNHKRLKIASGKIAVDTSKPPPGWMQGMYVLIRWPVQKCGMTLWVWYHTKLHAMSKIKDELRSTYWRVDYERSTVLRASVLLGDNGLEWKVLHEDENPDYKHARVELPMTPCSAPRVGLVIEDFEQRKGFITLYTKPLEVGEVKDDSDRNLPVLDSFWELFKPNAPARMLYACNTDFDVKLDTFAPVNFTGLCKVVQPAIYSSLAKFATRERRPYNERITSFLARTKPATLVRRRGAALHRAFGLNKVWDLRFAHWAARFQGRPRYTTFRRAKNTTAFVHWICRCGDVGATDFPDPDHASRAARAYFNARLTRAGRARFRAALRFARARFDI
jgi:hypothetical protein